MGQTIGFDGFVFLLIVGRRSSATSLHSLLVIPITVREQDAPTTNYLFLE